ncbi:hypothetical protein, partial [Thermolongibacillus altinsuensis]|uniref:hypothetical protein n=1 Tax=Thermolongibacillus altinsuensis TaxID=575256 RepID=UPI0025557B48
VSHKTKNSHYLKHITLVDKALLWIEAQDLYSYIPEKNFFFLPTREEKIALISELKLDVFIDDLLEVLEDRNFPDIHKLFFCPDSQELNSWVKIKDHFKVME